jgi:hypothetical protein
MKGRVEGPRNDSRNGRRCVLHRLGYPGSHKAEKRIQPSPLSQRSRTGKRIVALRKGLPVAVAMAAN